ncbi:hypothetical protein U5N28_16245 [Lysinibacillus telephonicus]|uniref:hypothetical protein n=1 Tax=Lysinibacillus telephonicus TaxID=1714840 RepID=UPI00397B3E2D
MASYTPNLDLLKKDPVADAGDTFNIKTMMNDNWDKIDEGFGALQTEVTEHLAETKQYAIATMSASQTIANDTNVTVKFDTITNYNGASFIIDANGNFILNKGIYEIKSYVRFAGIVNPTGYRQLGGGPYANRVSPVVGSETIVEFVREIEALEDNTVTGISARHTQGTALDILSTSSFVIIRKVA